MANLVKTGPKLIDGKKLRAELMVEQGDFFASRGPVEVSFLVPLDEQGSQAYDPATERFAKGQRGYGEKVGVGVNILQVAQANMKRTLRALGRAPMVYGVVMGEPLPDATRAAELRSAIPVRKDIDGANPNSRFNVRRPTPSAMVYTAESEGVDLRSVKSAVIGCKGNIGSSLMRLLQEVYGVDPYGIDQHNGGELHDVVRGVDVVFSAANRPGIITPDMLAGSSKVVVDAAIIPQARPDGSVDIIGSVDPLAYADHRVGGAITPVPGGVGVLNQAMAFMNLQEVVRGL